MREIIFRGKHKELGHWVYGDLIHDRDGKVYIDTSQNEVIPETVGQYTGKKGKNGQEIYEGDRIKGEYDFVPGTFEKGTVVWNKDLACYSLETDGLEPIRPALSCFASLEKIGNIYENPELLERS